MPKQVKKNTCDSCFKYFPIINGKEKWGLHFRDNDLKAESKICSECFLKMMNVKLKRAKNNYAKESKTKDG
jgi:hypothetical protein